LNSLEFVALFSWPRPGTDCTTEQALWRCDRSWNLRRFPRKSMRNGSIVNWAPIRSIRGLLHSGMSVLPASSAPVLSRPQRTLAALPDNPCFLSKPQACGNYLRGRHWRLNREAWLVADDNSSRRFTATFWRLDTGNCGHPKGHPTERSSELLFCRLHIFFFVFLRRGRTRPLLVPAAFHLTGPASSDANACCRPRKKT